MYITCSQCKNVFEIHSDGKVVLIDENKELCPHCANFINLLKQKEYENNQDYNR